MNGAQIVAEILKREGTEFLSCYPRNPLIEACAALDIRPILCRQERVGVGIADGYSRIKRGKQNGVFAAQAGPGIENAFPGIAQAYSENVPMLIVSGGLPLARQYVRPVFRAADVYRPVTKWSALAHSVQELPDLMRRAYHAMRTGKGGPVLVEVPDEVFEAEFKGKLDYTPVPVQRAAPDPDAVKAAVQMLLAAKNPVLWAGQGVHYAEAGERAGGARRAGAGAGRHHQSGQERDPRKPSAVARRLDPLARQDVHRFHGESRPGAGDRLEPHQDAVRARRAARQDHHPFHQRRRRHQQGVSRRPRPGRRRRAGARRADRRGRPAEGPGRRQCARLAQGGDRRRQEGLARRMGEAPRFRRDAAQPVPRDPRPDAHGRPRQRHHDARFRQPARADDAVLGDHRGRLLHGLGQVDPARLWARHHHGRQARGARTSSAST